MRKIIRCSILFFTLISTENIHGQAIPNGDFEVWNKVTTYENPQYWVTPNDITAMLSVFSVTKEATDTQSGLYSARLESKTIMTYVVPGFMTLGTFTFDMTTMDAKIFGGIPFTDRPAYLNGYLKYTPASGESYLIYTMLYKYDTVNGIIDTIGFGIKTGSDTISSWTGFSIPITYFKSDAPDSMNIVVLSSASMNPKAGSVLLVDSFFFDDEPMSVKNPVEHPQISIYPNPASADFIISGRDLETVEIYNTLGEHAGTYQAQRKSTLSVDCNSFTPGIYIIRCKSRGQWYSSKIMIR